MNLLICFGINQKHLFPLGVKQALLSLIAWAALAAWAHGDILLRTGFEGSLELPSGWTQSQVSGDATWTIQTGGAEGGHNPASANSGANNATLYRRASDNLTRLISPVFDSDVYTTATLTFYHTQELWWAPQDELKVFYSSDGGSTWTELVHYTENVSSWTLRTLVLPTSSVNSRIAFEGNATFGYGVCLDDIVVTGSPSQYSTFSVSATDDTASEIGSDPGSWTITRTGKVTEAHTVNYSLSGTAAVGDDYSVDTPSPLNFAAGQTSAVVTMTPVDDTVEAEEGEFVTLTLTESNAYLIDQAAGDISIFDDEGFGVNILVVGSTRSFSEGGEGNVVHETPFNPTSIANHLEGICAQSSLVDDTVNVVYEDIYKTKTQTVNYSGSSMREFTSHCYSLAQHFLWPEGEDERLANLRGEAGTEWDYIVLTFDPYIMANFPGMVAEGVRFIQGEVAQSGNPAQVVLLGQWPENSSSFAADDFNEIVYRVGNSADLVVVPAGKAWDSLASQDTSAAHPTPNGAYLAAAAIYSQLFNASASASGYTYVDASTTTAIADHALSVVQANTAASQYTGDYTKINPFKMKYVNKRVVHFRETGTSTENRIREALDRLDDVQKITLSTTGYTGSLGTRWDFNYGRGNDWWEDDKDYEVDLKKYDRSYGFPMHHYTTSNAPITMPYGIDKHYQNGTTYEDGTDLGIAYNMIRPGTRELGIPEDVRAVPIRLMWLKMREAFPGFNPLGDNTHMGSHLNDATAAFMYTLLSGRCPVIEEPATQGSTEWQQWLGHKIGYETAWQMAHLTTRAPGFRVLPSSATATSVAPGTTETMTLNFVNPPQENVIVTVSLSDPAAAIVSPKTLVFTSSDYHLPREVKVTGLTGSILSAPFDVQFSTSSADEIYDDLTDTWGYTTNRESNTSVDNQVDHGTTQVFTEQFTPLDLSLNVPGATAANTVFAGPLNGSIAWAGSEDIQYTPTGDYLGIDQITYAVTVGGSQTIGCIDISVQIPIGQANAGTSDSSASEEGPDTGNFVISRLGETTDPLMISFTMSGSAQAGVDYMLSQASPITIPAGQSSVTLILTPIDDSVFGERNEIATLRITEDSSYPVGVASVSLTIGDNDNNTPTLSAGPDQSTQIDAVSLSPGLSYGEVVGNINTRTPNPRTQILVDPSSETENSIGVLTTEVYTGRIYDADGQISFTEHIDDRSRIWIDGALVLTDNSRTDRTSTENLNLSPGWHDIEIRISNNTGANGPPNGEIGIGFDPSGGTTWQTLTDPGDGSFLETMLNLSSATVSLNGSVADVDGDPLTSLWTVVSGSSGTVTFNDPSAINTIASFSEAGTYVLRLTVDDGFEQVWDEVTISVRENFRFDNWVAGYDIGGQRAFSDDPDHDGVLNAVESYFGSHPNEFSPGVLTVNADPDLGNFTFTHPINSDLPADITARYRWSKNLKDFHYHGESDSDQMVVSFAQGVPVNGMVTVTATVTGAVTERIFVNIEVTSN